MKNLLPYRGENSFGGKYSSSEDGKGFDMSKASIYCIFYCYIVVVVLMSINQDFEMSARNPTIDDILNANDSDEDVEGINVNLEQLLDDEDSDDEGDLDLDEKIADFKKSVPPPNKTPKDSSSTPTSMLAVEVPPVEKKEISELLAALGKVKYEEPADIKTFDAPSTDHDFDIYNDISTLNNGDGDYEANKVVTLLSTLELADRREQKLVRGGDRDTISALHAKIASMNDSSSNNTSNSINKPTSHSNLKCNNLETISSQLCRNAKFKQHGPGVASVVKINSKYIAIGTSRGLILLFDSITQEMKQVLGSHITNIANNAPTPVLAITAIDVSISGDFIVCGNENGEIFIWDVLKGAIVKRISDIHTSKIFYVNIVYRIGDKINTSLNNTLGVNSDMSLISIDNKGMVNRTILNKVMWLVTSDTDCLLDGNAGIMLDVVPLLPYYAQASLIKV